MQRMCLLFFRDLPFNTRLLIRNFLQLKNNVCIEILSVWLRFCITIVPFEESDNMLCSTYARKMEHCNSETDLERDASKIGTISVRGRNNDENKAKCQNQFDANSLHKSVTIGNFCHSKISMKRPRSRPKIMMNNFYLILPRRHYFTLYKTKLAR